MAGEAIQRLARFERFHEQLLADQAAIAGQLEALRSQGKQKSVKFRELLAEKLTGAQILLRLKRHGLE